MNLEEYRLVRFDLVSLFQLLFLTCCMKSE